MPYLVTNVAQTGVRVLAHAAHSGTTGDQAATFTVDFLDDLDFAREIVGHGQSCVLTIGQPRTVSALVGGQPQAKTVVTATLSCDHRTVDGAVGAAWLQEFRNVFQTPSLLLL